ncbi:hypothetical protein C3F00_037375, partial [Pseudomonas sp. MWU13-2860]
TNRDYERRYLPVRIPIDRGLLGYRVLLIRAARQPEFAKVTTLAELRRFSIIQGEGWGDIAVLRRAGLKVETDSSYDGLFRMLDRGLGDAFSRGVTEVEREIRDYRPQYRLPLYQAVFHDSIVTSNHWLYDNLKFSNAYEDNLLAQWLYNVPPLWHLSAASLERRLPLMRCVDRVFQPLHRRLATQPLSGFAWLTSDRQVQQTRDP